MRGYPTNEDVFWCEESRTLSVRKGSPAWHRIDEWRLPGETWNQALDRFTTAFLACSKETPA